MEQTKTPIINIEPTYNGDIITSPILYQTAGKILLYNIKIFRSLDYFSKLTPNPIVSKLFIQSNNIIMWLYTFMITIANSNNDINDSFIKQFISDDQQLRAHAISTSENRYINDTITKIRENDLKNTTSIFDSNFFELDSNIDYSIDEPKSTSILENDKPPAIIFTLINSDNIIKKLGTLIIYFYAQLLFMCYMIKKSKSNNITQSITNQIQFYEDALKFASDPNNKKTIINNLTQSSFIQGKIFICKTIGAFSQSSSKNDAMLFAQLFYQINKKPELSNIKLIDAFNDNFMNTYYQISKINNQFITQMLSIFTKHSPDNLSILITANSSISSQLLIIRNNLKTRLDKLFDSDGNFIVESSGSLSLDYMYITPIFQTINLCYLLSTNIASKENFSDKCSKNKFIYYFIVIFVLLGLIIITCDEKD